MSVHNEAVVLLTQIKYIETDENNSQMQSKKFIRIFNNENILLVQFQNNKL